jgi:hypothetical protein
VGTHHPYVGQIHGTERDEMINEYERRILDAMERHECAADPRFAQRLVAANSWERWASAWRRLTTRPVLVLAVVVAIGAFALHVSAIGLLLTAWVSVAMAMRLIRSAWRGDANADGREGPRNAASAGPDGAVL